MRADRHIVIGSRGTALAATSAVALIDAPPTSPEARAWEELVFGHDASGAGLDPTSVVDHDAPTSFALAASTGGRTMITVHGEVTVEIDGRVWTPAPDATAPVAAPWATIDVADDAGVVLSLAESGSPTGQWVTTGVIAAGSVVLGKLRPPPRAPAAVSEGRPTEGDADPEAGADVGLDSGTAAVDFGNLVGGRSPRPSPGRPSDGVAHEPAASTDPADGHDDPQAVTSPFMNGSGGAGGGVVRLSDGRVLEIGTPIVFGRRPPEQDELGRSRQLVEIDDAMVSRHHATVVFADGRLVVVDEGSANGTTVSLPGSPPVRCQQGLPVEVPPGATIDIGGVLTARYERGSPPC